MSIELVAIDLDDTLLDSRWRVPEACREAINTVQKMGIRVTLATGRMFQSALPYARELQIDLPLITYQGALIKEDQSGEILHFEPLPRYLAAEIMLYFRDRGIFYQSYFNDRFCIDRWSPEAKYYAELSGMEPRFYDDLMAASREEDTPKILATIFDEEKILSVERDLKQRYAEELHITRSKPVFLEVMKRSVDKGLALQILAYNLGIPRERVLAFGDSYNDLAMIKWAGIGVAMANSPGEVKAVADYLAPSNEEEGVARALHDIVLGRGV